MYRFRILIILRTVGCGFGIYGGAAGAEVF